jgi:hypothetical protein
LKEKSEEFLEAFVGEANVSVALGPEINWFDGISELFFEGIVNVGVCTPLKKELGVLSHHLAKLGSCDAWLDVGLCARIIHDGEGLSWRNGVMHSSQHHDVKVAVGASSMVGWDRGSFLF